MCYRVSSNQCLTGHGSWIAGCLIRVWCALLVCCLVLPGRGPLAADFAVLVDEYDTSTPQTGLDINAVGGNRGTLNEADAAYTWDGDSVYTLTIVDKAKGANWTWGGMWQSVNRRVTDELPLAFTSIFGPYVKGAYQGQITQARVVVTDASSPSRNKKLTLRLELKARKSGKETIVCPVSPGSWTKAVQGPFPKTLTWDLPAACRKDIQLVTWVLDGAQVGDTLSVDRLQLLANVPDLPTADQAFLWSYAALMANYNPATGLVVDRSSDGPTESENVSATAKTAKLAAYAYLKGFTTLADARTIVSKIADTLLNKVKPGPEGVNTLWPHFTAGGGSSSAGGSEWSSGDTAFAALDLMAALQVLDDPDGRFALQRSQVKNFLVNIKWSDLLKPLNCNDARGLSLGISLGYYDDGTPIPFNPWRNFGMETIGVDWAYAAATGQAAGMCSCGANGSGFIDNANYPVVLSGVDQWGNDWDAYRQQQADRQMNWYCDQPTPHYNSWLCAARLFGLSAAENPLIAQGPADGYVAYGIGGCSVPPQDGSSLTPGADGNVIVLHYSGMIADIRPDNSLEMWEALRDRTAQTPAFLKGQSVISPLNNMESMWVDRDTGKVAMSRLKGSWNLALQGEGWALSDPLVRARLAAAIQDNAFLLAGYRQLVKLADLRESAVGAPPASAGVDQALVAADTVDNAGLVSVGASQTRYFLSHDTTKSADDVVLGNRFVPPLAPGQPNSGNSNVTLPNLTPGQSWYLLACADAAQGYIEDSESNNCAASSTAMTIGADRTAPRCSLAINGGSTATRTASVTLTLSATDASGIAQMCISNTATCKAWTPYATPKGWALAAGNGTKSVSAWFKDGVGNASPTPCTAQIILDALAPTNGAVVAQPGDQEVALSWTGFADAHSGVATYKAVFSTVGAPASCAVGTTGYQGSDTAWVHKGLSNGKTYYYRVCASDGAGNSSTGASASARPAPETSPPTGGTVVIDAGAAATRSTGVTLAISASDPSGVVQMCISNTAVCAAWGPYAASKTWTLAAGNGSKTVSVWFRDAWGNTSTSPATDSIMLDATAPTNGVVVAIPGNAQVALSWSGFTDANSGVASYKIVYGTTRVPVSCLVGTAGHAGPETAWVHSGRINGRTYYYRVCASDGAGNMSTGATASGRPRP